MCSEKCPHFQLLDSGQTCLHLCCRETDKCEILLINPPNTHCNVAHGELGFLSFIIIFNLLNPPSSHCAFTGKSQLFDGWKEHLSSFNPDSLVLLLKTWCLATLVQLFLSCSSLHIDRMHHGGLQRQQSTTGCPKAFICSNKHIGKKIVENCKKIREDKMSTICITIIYTF